MRMKRDTSWGEAAEWYSDYLETTPDSYQHKVILPNLLRILDLKKDRRLIDIACGQGFFSREFARAGASVTGADISETLVAEAKRLSPPSIAFHVAPAHRLAFASDASFDLATIVLAIQNMDNIEDVFKETARILGPRGRLVLVMMHPAFRVPKRSNWEWDEKTRVQYRRVDGYLSANRSEFLVHPGKKKSPITISHHRSLQDISKALFRAGFVISRLEEWISHKRSEMGPRQKAEDLARKEIPLFLMLETRRDT